MKNVEQRSEVFVLCLGFGKLLVPSCVFDEEREFGDHDHPRCHKASILYRGDVPWPAERERERTHSWMKPWGGKE